MLIIQNMNGNEIVKNWFNASKQDLETAVILFENKKYHHALFFCHLSIEKYLKAIIIKTTKKAPPLIHDLVRLAEKTDIKLTDKIKNELADISAFNIQARDDDHKLSFYKKANKRFTAKYLKTTKEILLWLKGYF
jgi:AbiV family abortive infection protein